MRKRLLRLALATALALTAIGVAAPAQAATPTGAVTVMLLTSNGAKLELPNVVVNLSGPLYYENAFTTAHGRATFSNVPTGRSYSAFIYQQGEQGLWTRITVAKAVPTFTAGHHVWVAIVFRLAGSISGRVVDTTGAPVAGVQVLAKDIANGDTEPAKTTADGTYAIVKLRSGTYKLSVSGTGIVPKFIGNPIPVVAQYGTAPPSRITGVDTVVVRTG